MVESRRYVELVYWTDNTIKYIQGLICSLGYSRNFFYFNNNSPVQYSEELGELQFCIGKTGLASQSGYDSVVYRSLL